MNSTPDKQRRVKLVSAFFAGSCPECNGGHTCHEGNVMGHAVGCSLKPETQIAAMEDQLDQALDALREVADWGTGSSTLEDHRIFAANVHYIVRATLAKLDNREDT